MKAFKCKATKYYKYGDPNVTNVGSVTISNGVASGFTTAKYLRTTNVWFTSNWEVCVKFTTGSDVTTMVWVVGGGGSQNRLILGYGSSKFRIILSSNNTSADLANTAGSYTVKTNTTYWLKVQFTGTKYVVSYSTDGKTFTTDITVTSSTALYDDGNPLSLGANQFSNGVNYPMTVGSIDLKGCYIKQLGKTTWAGMKQVETTSANYDYSKEVDVYKILKQEVLATDGDYSSTATLINADGVVPNGGGNGWTVYDKSANKAEVYLMLNASISSDYPRWQVQYSSVGSDNCICYFKTPQKGIISKIDTYTWWDDTLYKRGVQDFDIYGFNSEADLLAFTNGTKIFQVRIVIHSNLKGALHTISALTEQPFQYFAIKMIINNASDGYKSIGKTKFYMRLPASGYITKYYGFQ